MSTIFIFLVWYFLVSLAGWLAFPLAYRMLPALTGRGLILTRILGLLLWGYFFWLLATLGLLPNNPGGILFALLLVIVVSLWALWNLGQRAQTEDGKLHFSASLVTGWNEVLIWLQGHKGLIIRTEALFLGAFALWTLVRAANPGIFGTEKPMEVAFINAILHSDWFPPRDPWLSGYSISYYYFGYVIIAMLARLSGVGGHIAFNLGIALIFSLSAIGAYGVVFNLLARRRSAQPNSSAGVSTGRTANQAFLAPVIILLVSNVEGFLEVLHARGLLSAAFWRWLDIVDINQAPQPPFHWLPRLYGTGSWWWWRASRVVQDYDLAGNPREIIDEFPVFSYLLADLHPHVLAMPFAFLAVALALNLFLGGAQGHLRGQISSRGLAWASILAVLGGAASMLTGMTRLSLVGMLLGAAALMGGTLLYLALPSEVRRLGLASLWRSDIEQVPYQFGLHIAPAYFLLAGITLGGLGFFNTWDFPFYVAIFAGAYALRAAWGRGDLVFIRSAGDFLSSGLLLGISGVVLFLPFYLSFSSQAGGIIPNLIYVTRGAHLWVMFATLLLPLFAYLVDLVWSLHGLRVILRGLLLALSVAFGFWLLAFLLAFAALRIPGVSDLYLSSQGAASAEQIFEQAFVRRFMYSGGWLTLVLLFGLAISALWPRRRSKPDEMPWHGGLDKADGFIILLVLVGCLLALGPEFFYLRDQFGWRINTIFKFYFQAWNLWGLAAAYAVVVLWSKKGWLSWLVNGVIISVLIMGSAYTLLGVWDQTSGFSPVRGLTLDGMSYLNPEEIAAIQWLAQQPPGALVEAVGGSYSPRGHGRVSAFSGQPAVLGWPGHESQWRGGGEEMGSRQSDIEQIYCNRDWPLTQALLERYEVRYVYVGELERTTYTQETCGTGLDDNKFFRYLNPVYRLGSVTIFEVPR